MKGFLDVDGPEEYSAFFYSIVDPLNEWEEELTENGGKFVNWLEKRKEVMVKNMIASVRSKVKTLGTPPEKFYTNLSESGNRVIKVASPGEHPVGPFFEAMAKMMKSEIHQLDMAIIGRGDCHLSDMFQHLRVSEDKWFSLDLAEKESSLKKIHALPLSELITMENLFMNIPVAPETVTDHEYHENFQNDCADDQTDNLFSWQEEKSTKSRIQLSVSPHEFAVATKSNLSLAVLTHIWNKTELILDKNVLVKKPCLVDKPTSSNAPDEKYYVANLSNQSDYSVSVYSSGKYLAAVLVIQLLPVSVPIQ